MYVLPRKQIKTNNKRKSKQQKPKNKTKQKKICTKDVSGSHHEKYLLRAWFTKVSCPSKFYQELGPSFSATKKNHNSGTWYVPPSPHEVYPT
jgi:hypothetical protein